MAEAEVAHISIEEAAMSETQRAGLAMAQLMGTGQTRSTGKADPYPD
jgi:hypothetical protein